MRLRLWLLVLGLSAGRPGGSLRRRTADEGSPASLQTPHWEVVPELSCDGRPLTLDDVLQTLPDRLQLSLALGTRSAHMDLHRSRQLLPDFHTVSYYHPDGRRVTERRPHQVNCYYHGTLVGRDGPWSDLSLCSGLRGTVILPAEQWFSIEPAQGTRSHKHIVRLIIEKKNITRETHEEDTAVNKRPGRVLLSLSDESARPHRVESEVKYVELVMVADNSEFTMLHQDLRGLHVRMMEIANRVDAFYRTLNLRVVLVMVEVWSQKDLISVSEDPAETLNRFLAWREKDLVRRVHHDNAQLLTGVTFKDSSVGMATINSMCTVDRSGGVTRDHSVSVLAVASTMAHELGHNLGLNHDVGDGTCGQPKMGKQWIMAQSTGFMPGLEFSNCSRKDLISSLRQGGGLCLYNLPSPGSLYGRATCGNLLVEKGEQCDCGLLQECLDPCCNASSCQLMPGAECASDGLCCEQCKVKSPGTLCRQPLGECDLPEYCNGVSPHCPANVYLQNGEPCESGHAHCYQGECRTLQKQCLDIWGPGSSPAPDSCFAKVNVRGDKYGNCGRATNGSYLPCGPRNVLCGRIQCLGGRDRPLLGTSAEVISVKISVNGTEVSCRGTYFNLGDDVWDSVLVKTGTVCRPGQVCVNRQCRDAAELKAQACRCGGHGVCNSNGNCHCDPGWAPPHCDSSGHGGSQDSGPISQDSASSSVAGTVFLVLLVICLVVVLFFCYLKRGCLQRMLCGVFSSSSKCQYRVTHSSGPLRPQRPPPPHRTQSTELQVMSASNQSDYEGCDRPDPPSKPLPPDPVQRRSQVSSFTKPSPPKKPLPLSPIAQCQDPLLGVDAFSDHVAALPARHALRPPYARRTPKV
ncbi:disintegrin and metalloproteinase domain-containing protein 15-like isoform X2 [Bufo bufo]|uniref:disintegrin and metalloproteinase domain-containing protein 15 isoform X2 n=1 Tax=Bufo bufo TaxID=8384 RepID=UPI001ABDEE87|nr:disintegrin and metalloproteinase domain-containing protein 15 isoform X2 [Bufo bufo]XP_040268536.1 disintegrin and metalloproteinase domain-containing protein 15-like isoform X2 [Bufo bufo]